MHRKKIAASIAVAGLLAGCSPMGPTEHASCKDAQSTEAYSVKWQGDLAAARWADKLSVDQAVEIQGEVFTKLKLLKQENWTDFCNHLDSVRAASGF